MTRQAADMTMTEAEQRAAVVAEARSWIGTPYHHCAAIKGVGADCGMMIIAVFRAAGLIADFDPRPYSPDWHLHHDEERYLDVVLRHAREVDAPRPGDLMVFRWGRSYAHGGIVTGLDPLAIVHAYFPARGVFEDEVARDANLSEPRRAPRFFSHWKASS
jgi:NlpC/P60 family putative phage cell wall peptidase